MKAPGYASYDDYMGEALKDPAKAAAISRFLGEKMRGDRWVAAMIGVAGVVVVVAPRLDGLAGVFRCAKPDHLAWRFGHSGLNDPDCSRRTPALIVTPMPHRTRLARRRKQFNTCWVI